MAALAELEITTLSGNTIALTASSVTRLRSREYTLRITGDNVFFAFGEVAKLNYGIFLKANDVMVVSGVDAFLDLYAVSEGTSQLYIEG